MTASQRPSDRHDSAGHTTDLYAVLGVSPDAELGELGRAYRRRLRQLHPDTHGQRHGEDQAGGPAAPSLGDVLHAYTVLRDPARRAGYDRTRAAQRAEPGSRQDAISAGTSVPIPIPVRYRHGPSNPQPWIRVGPVRRHPRPC